MTELPRHAKPLIDMLLVVSDSRDKAVPVPATEADGDILLVREPDWREHRVLKRPDTR